MLKIKDEVDLKELEKFGFQKHETENTYYRKKGKVTDNYQTFFERLEISEEDRVIRTILYNDLSDQYWEGVIERTGRVLDLEKAGLIEVKYKE